MNMEVRVLGRVDYLPTYAAMQAFTASRHEISSQIGHQPNQDVRNQLWYS